MPFHTLLKACPDSRTLHYKAARISFGYNN
ncbi:hypothetical protein EYZ11_009590 [Aspergillus tanneri]|uniref:Uncharacterized protein n=1 Tax=Aspergillus tanneri TaxID=1220188 RepID=A0A4S3J7P3_9EURO|nr:hypothetical protein EYZ11_009590 [Aspergillus tanneri]